MSASSKLPKIVFWIAGIWGLIILAPLYFIFNLIGRQDPPPITHPGFYYGFVGAALAWQFAFLVIARDPIRFRPIIILAVFEKFSYGMAMIALYLQNRIRPGDAIFGVIDILFGVLFGVSFILTRPSQPTFDPRI